MVPLILKVRVEPVGSLGNQGTAGADPWFRLSLCCIFIPVTTLLSTKNELYFFIGKLSIPPDCQQVEAFVQ